MRSSWRYWDGVEWFLAFLAVFALVAALLIVLQDCSAQDRCESSGGRIERYNHHTVLVPVSVGKTTILMPEDASDWRCVK